MGIFQRSFTRVRFEDMGIISLFLLLQNFLFLREYFIESLLVFSPVFMHLHTESEEYFFIENTLEDEAGPSADFLDLGSSLSDHDDFLTFRFDVDIDLEREHRRLPVDLLFYLAHFDI